MNITEHLVRYRRLMTMVKSPGFTFLGVANIEFRNGYPFVTLTNSGMTATIPFAKSNSDDLLDFMGMKIIVGKKCLFTLIGASGYISTRERDFETLKEIIVPV